MMQTVACLLLALVLPIASLHAQIEAGQVVDDSVHTPLQHVTVSLQRLTNGAWQVVDSTQTDDRGLFQFRPTDPGILRVGVLGTSEPRFAGAVDTLAADSVNERMLLVPLLRSMRHGVYFEFQVEKAAAVTDPSRTPVYPIELRAKHVGGEVDAQFVVDVDGSVDIRTFKVLRSTREEFTKAVRQFLISARYVPAFVADHAVRQVVQQQFMFDPD